MASKREGLAIIAVFVAFGCAVVAGAIVMAADEKKRCVSRWKESGMTARYDRHNGCEVRMENGWWVPEKAIKITVNVNQ